jgi:rhodanese-related sulfurtransferase
MDINKRRATKRKDTQMVPQPIEGQTGLVQVDTTWGTIQPIQIDKNIRTVGETELNEYQEKGMQIIDAQTADFYQRSTIPGAKNIPHNQIIERMDELDRSQAAIVFCNGPQCTQSPDAIRNLVEAGYPKEMILYYRGGMHDWVTMGLSILENP